MRNELLSFAAVSALLVSGCSREPETAPAARPVAADLARPVGLVTGPACTADFPSPKPGTEIRYTITGNDGALVPVALSDRVVAVNGDVVGVEQRMEMIEGDKTPSVMPYQRQSIVFWRSSGASGAALREYRYTAPDLSRRLKALTPGEAMLTTVRESTNFEGGGARTIEGDHAVTFLGCGEVDVAGAQEPAKIFEVRSIGRSYRSNAPSGKRETVLQTRNIIWVSSRAGWVLKDMTADGATTALEIKHAS